MSNYKVVKELATLRTDTRRQLRLNVMKWDGKPGVKYDLRLWYEGLPDDWAPGKGIILSEDEARRLVFVLENEFVLADRRAVEERGGRVIMQAWQHGGTVEMVSQFPANRPDGDQEAENDAPDGQ